MAQWVKGPTAKFDNLISIPRTYMVAGGRADSREQSSDHCGNAVAREPPSPTTQNKQIHV